VTTSGRNGGVSRLARLTPSLALLPFLLYLTVFLLVPTITVVVGAFAENGRFTLANITALADPVTLTALRTSVLLSAVSAVIGAVFGAVLAYLIVSGGQASWLRRSVISLSGVLAQCGGVMLAFAFIATIGYSGVLTVWLQDHLGIDIFGSGWLFALPGLILVYAYFQIPLMVIVFLPALDGIKPQWREASVNLGANGWQYWTQVAFPLLRPAFLGATLLLFANAFAAYATAAALVSQGNPIVPLLIRSGLSSEVLLGHQHLAYALAFEMIVVVAAVMGMYGLLLRRTARWLR
jgi:putative spermidine/putrescine transport system permease protein